MTGLSLHHVAKQCHEKINKQRVTITELKTTIIRAWAGLCYFKLPVDGTNVRIKTVPGEMVLGGPIGGAELNDPAFNLISGGYGLL